MTNVPYYLPKARWGQRMGDSTMVDGMIADGLWDVYGKCHMGSYAELCAETHSISREDQAPQYKVSNMTTHSLSCEDQARRLLLHHLVARRFTACHLMPCLLIASPLIGR